jgi:hypothetical protein
MGRDCIWQVGSVTSFAMCSASYYSALSRAFPPRLLGEVGEGIAPVLIPGLDSFNHSREAKVTWTWNKEPTEHITLTLHQPLYNAKQVFNSYGPKSNEELIASYGFVNEGMDDDVVTLKLGGQNQTKTQQQHHWRYQGQCPPLLLEEVKAALRQGQDDEQSLVSDELIQEGEALDTVAGLLEAKIVAFEAAQRRVDEDLKEGTSIRDAVRHCITVYRRSESGRKVERQLLNTNHLLPFCSQARAAYCTLLSAKCSTG